MDLTLLQHYPFHRPISHDWRNLIILGSAYGYSILKAHMHTNINGEKEKTKRHTKLNQFMEVIYS